MPVAAHAREVPETGKAAAAGDAAAAVDLRQLVVDGAAVRVGGVVFGDVFLYVVGHVGHAEDRFAAHERAYR